jgi:hypothetical protein
MPIATSELADALSAVQAEVLLPIVVGTADEAAAGAVADAARGREGLVIVHLRDDDPGRALERALAGRGMRCGVLVAGVPDGWTLTAFGACATPHAGAVVEVAPAPHPDSPPIDDGSSTVVRGGVGLGVSTLALAGRLELDVERWPDPWFGYGLRLHDSGNGLFDTDTAYGVEPYGAVATDGRLRAVGEAGVGIAASIYKVSGWSLFGPDSPDEFQPAVPAATASVAGGMMSRHAGVALLLRVDGALHPSGFTRGVAGCVLELQVGGRVDPH